MDNLTPGEQAFADLVAAGIDADTLTAELRCVPTQEPNGDIIIAAVSEGTAGDLRVTSLRRVPNLRSPFGFGLAVQAAGMAEKSMRSRESCLVPFIDFLAAKGMAEIRPRDITNAMLDEFKDWLDDYEKPVSAHKRPPSSSVFPSKGGGKLKVSTKIACMGQVLAILRMLRVDGQWWVEIGHDLDLIRANDWSAGATDRLPVEILTRPQLKMLVRICREEVAEITGRLHAAWAVLDNDPPASLASNADREIIFEVAALHHRFNGKPPKQQALRRELGNEKQFYPRLAALSRAETAAYNAALATIYPTGRMLMPFLILFAIYYRYNFSVVTTMKASSFSQQPSVHGLRLRGMPFKNRAGRTQYASWPVTDEPHNPAEMLKTLERWTSFVRERAGPGTADHIFLERIFGSKTRSLNDAYGFSLNFSRFLRDHENRIGKRFIFRALRPSVINLVHHLFDGDLLATVEAGQHSMRTLLDHYLFDGARKMNEEALVPAMHFRDAWVQTNGKIDGREDKRRGDISAATPGFGCQDRYASKMAGQRPERLCTAYGMCPICPLRKVDTSSPEAYALIVKLREAIIRSRHKMPAATWLARWSPVQDRLETKILRQFPPETRDLADHEIPQLPTVE